MNNLLKNILFIVLIYIPLEEFILKWLPISTSSVIFLKKVTVDFIVVSTLFLLILHRIVYKNSKVKINSSYIILIIFILTTIAVYISNIYDFNTFFAKEWVTIRFILVAFIAMNLRFNEQDIEKIYNITKYLMIFEFLVGLSQFFELGLGELFIPRTGDEITNWYVIDTGNIGGSFELSIHYSYLMLIFLLMQLSLKKYNLLLSIMALAGILLGGSMICFLVGLFFCFVSIRTYKPKMLYALIPFLGVLFIFIIFNTKSPIINFILNTEFGELFTSKYWIGAIHTSRVGILLLIPNLFIEGLRESLIGFSYNYEALENFFSQLSHTPIVVRQNVKAIEDIYWVAALYYYGILGLFLYVLFLIMNFKMIKNKYLIYNHRLYKIFINFFIAMVILNFVNQSLSIKIFSYYFWLFLGMSISFIPDYQLNLYNNISNHS